MMELSIVMVIGNNDYGNKIYREIEPAVPTPEKKRTEYCLFTLREAFKNIDYELIIVEWLGSESGEKPSGWEFLSDNRTRVIRVPYEFTSSVCPERPFHETHAKNIGIRRAKADMILSINNDCLWLDEFPREVLEYKQDVVVADRPTVYHTILDCDLDIKQLRTYCARTENIVHAHDLNSNGDFTLMHRNIWWALQGLPTPKGDALAGLDIWQVNRAEQFLKKQKLVYRSPIFHLRHPGAPLSSSWGKTLISEDWGFSQKEFSDG